MSRRPKKSDMEVEVEKNRARDEAKRTQQLRERIARTFQFQAEAEVVRKKLVPLPLLSSKEVDKPEKQDSSTAPNFPKGMRVIDYNAMREAEILHNVNEQIKRGSYAGGSGDAPVYAEPVVPFSISADKIPGPATIDPKASLKPASWGKSKEKRLRNENAARARAAKYVKEEAGHGKNGDSDGRRSSKRGRARARDKVPARSRGKVAEG